jgi:hypothetical protein
VQVRINGTLPLWYFNDFFTDVNAGDATVYAKYFSTYPPINTTTPISTSPLPTYVPGAFPSADGLNDVLFGLEHVRYSSRYGGSVELHFRTVEDYEIDLRRGSTYWDITSLQMRVYVRPEANRFNPLPGPAPSNAQGVLQVEMSAQGVVAYELVSAAAQRQFVPLLDQDLEGLRIKLDSIAGVIEARPEGFGSNAFRLNAVRFVYGFVHSQFQNLIEPTNKVDMIELADDFLDPHTSPGEPTFNIQLRINDINLNTEPGDEEIVVTINTLWDYQGPSGPELLGAPEREFELGNREGTSFRTMAQWELDECPFIGTIRFLIDVTEEDGGAFLGDDHFDTDREIQVSPNCAGLQNSVNAGQFGPGPESIHDVVLTEQDDGDVAGAMSVSTRTSVFVR